MVRGGKRSVRSGKRQNGKGVGVENLSKRQKMHLKEFGEVHPAEMGSDDVKERYKVIADTAGTSADPDREDSVSESDGEEEESAYSKLINSIAPQQKYPGTESESESSEREDEEEDGEGEVEAEGNEEDDEEDKGEDEDGEEEDEDKEKDLDRTDYRNEEYASDEEEGGVSAAAADIFQEHFTAEHDDTYIEKLSEKSTWSQEPVKIPHVGKGVMHWPRDKTPPSCAATVNSSLKELHVKHSICNKVNGALQALDKSQDELSAFQLQLFSMLNQYHDVFYPERSAANAEAIRFVYLLHALNHILKTRDNVISHNNQIKSRRQDIPDEFRDQGLTRPKVLIILPFRSAVLRVVKILSKLIFQNDKANVLHMKKFLREFGVEDEDEMKNKPEDHRELFAGNTDDNFLLGLSLGKRSLKLYTKLYSSDVLIASPLALRLRVGADGDEDRDYDFLSSIEVLIMDQVDVFEMQNWDHVLHVMNHLHLQPKEAHAVNFSRVRMWTLNGWSKFFRQTLMFSSLVSPEINSVFSKHCSNFAGKIQLMKSPSSGSICQIVAQLPQVFHRIECSSLVGVDEARFEFFKKKILPKVQDGVMSNTFIFVSSYFDFVRLRNFLRKEESDFNYISEYCKHSRVSRARTLFQQNRVHAMLYTERFHFFNRLMMRGIRHLIFYELPAYAHFYSEVCNMLDSSAKNSEAVSFTCSVLYSKYDALRLAAVVGHERASHMIHSNKGVHLFVTGEETQQ